MIECVPVLVRYGADINRTSHLGAAAIHQAAQQGSLKTIMMLMQYGADINTANVEGKEKKKTQKKGAKRFTIFFALTF